MESEVSQLPLMGHQIFPGNCKWHTNQIFKNELEISWKIVHKIKDNIEEKERYESGSWIQGITSSYMMPKQLTLTKESFFRFLPLQLHICFQSFKERPINSNSYPTRGTKIATKNIKFPMTIKVIQKCVSTFIPMHVKRRLNVPKRKQQLYSEKKIQMLTY